MARERGPYSAAFPVDFTSKGDTTRDAFRKHMDEITRIYGILTGLDADTMDADAISGVANGLLQTHINSTTPHPNYKPSWSDILNKPSLGDLSGTLSASRVVGNLTGATIDYGRVNGLSAFMDGKISAKDSIKEGSLSQNGYISFANNLTLQWGKETLTADEFATNREVPRLINFPKSFSTSCFTVIAGTGIKVEDSSLVRDCDVIIQVQNITTTGFYYITQLFYESTYHGAEEIRCHYIAIGV